MNKKYLMPAFRITFIYFAFSALWIFLSDYFLYLFSSNITYYKNFSTIKGLFYILISSIIVYTLVKKEIVSIRNASVNIDKLKQYDMLTNTFNRMMFSRKVEEYYKQNKNLSVIIADIDGLKEINKNKSVSLGDEIIKSFAKLLQRLLPNESYIARISGGEFCVLIENCEFVDVREYSNLIYSEVNTPGSNYNFTVSIGYSSACNKLHNAFEAVSLAEDRMHKNKLLAENSSKYSVITSLQTSLFERSDETEKHGIRMAEMGKKIGSYLNFNYSEINDIVLLSLLHDIGKIGISDSILNKPGKLNKEEYESMKEHSRVGYKIASSIPSLATISNLILHHHERWDGTGYPNSVKGNDIPLCSRILSIVDAYDAMTHDRIYREAISSELALEEIIRNKGTQFDPEIVDIFIKIV